MEAHNTQENQFERDYELLSEQEKYKITNFFRKIQKMRILEKLETNLQTQDIENYEEITVYRN